MHVRERSTSRGLVEKFGDAFRGMKIGIRGQSSFFVHFFAAASVIAAAALLKIESTLQWAILLICITVVLVAEMFNSALESLAKAITDQVDSHVRNALDIGSAAVLIASLGASAVGAIVFLQHIGTLAGWW